MALGFGIPLAVAAVFFLFKANATVLFFVACATALLFDRGTRGIEKILGSTMSGTPQIHDYIIAAVLVLPVLIGLLLQSRHGKKWVMVQLLPSIASGLILYLLLVRVALYLFHTDLRSGLVWQAFSPREELLVAVGIFLCLVLMPFSGKGGGHHEGKHGKH